MSSLSKEKAEDESSPEPDELLVSSEDEEEDSSSCFLFESPVLDVSALQREALRFFLAPFRPAPTYSLSSSSLLLLDEEEDEDEDDVGGAPFCLSDEIMFLLEVGEGVKLDRLSARARAALWEPACCASSPDIDDFLGGGDGNSIVTSLRQ